MGYFDDEIDRLEKEETSIMKEFGMCVTSCILVAIICLLLCGAGIVAASVVNTIISWLS